jgi:hypothetical protein
VAVVGFLRSLKARMTVAKWAYGELGADRQRHKETFQWGRNEGWKSAESAWRLGRLVGIAGFSQAGKDFVKAFGQSDQMEARASQELAEAFRAGRAAGVEECKAKIAQYERRA